MFIYMVLMVVLIILNYIVHWLMITCNCGGWMLKYGVGNGHEAAVIRFLMEGFLEFSISGCINVFMVFRQTESFENFSMGLSSVVAFILVFILVVLPLKLIHISWRYHKEETDFA